MPTFFGYVFVTDVMHLEDNQVDPGPPPDGQPRVCREIHSAPVPTPHVEHLLEQQQQKIIICSRILTWTNKQAKTTSISFHVFSQWQPQ